LTGELYIFMKNLFDKPVVGQRVILRDTMNEESEQRIVEVTSRTIRVSSCNLYRFNRRDGNLNKACSRARDLKSSIRPISA
jgi:hypothetical protein